MKTSQDGLGQMFCIWLKSFLQPQAIFFAEIKIEFIIAQHKVA